MLLFLQLICWTSPAQRHNLETDPWEQNFPSLFKDHLSGKWDNHTFHFALFFWLCYTVQIQNTVQVGFLGNFHLNLYF